MLSYLKKSLFVLLLLASTAAWAGDEHHFIYIQSEKGELFYVRYKGKVLSASAKGYVIVPELPKGTAELVVGFPKNEIPEKHFSITLNGTRDEGFVIKHTSAQEIALFNLQTYTLVKPVAAETAAAPETAPAAETPAPVAAASAQPAPADASTAMMSSVKKDLDSTFANNKDVSIAAPQTTDPSTAAARPSAAPTKQPNKFASALDKVAGDDRPAEMDEPAPTPAAAAPVAATAAGEVAAAPVKKGKKPSKPVATQDGALTPEEQTYLKDVMAEEQKTAAAADAAATSVPDSAAQPVTQATQPASQPAAQPAAETTTPAADTNAAVAYTENAEPATTSKKKKKRTAGDDPQFIDFGANTPATNAAAGTTAATDAVAAPVEAAPRPARKKKQKRSDDAAADTVSGLKSDDWVTVNKQPTAAPETAATATPVAADKTTPALNSDCKQMLNNDSFKKLMRKVAAQGNESGMVETFNKNIRNTCLSAEQIRAFAQLIDTDEYRYRLLETAYVHTYETGKFVALQDLLKDDYYRKRFAAMLR